MNQKSILIFLTLFFHFLLMPDGVRGNAFQENPLTKAIQLFDKENYTEAEQLFKKILDERPDDFMVNYFYGACRTENGHYSEKDLNYLIKASKEVNPLNIDYYFAIQYHAKNQWEKALTYYGLYKVVSSANEQEKVNLALKMEQCSNQVNPFVSTDALQIADDSDLLNIAAEGASEQTVENLEQSSDSQLATKPVVVDSINNLITESEGTISSEQEISEINDSTIQSVEPKNDSLQVQEPTEVPELDVDISAEEQINFNINSEITYITVSNFRTEEGKNYFLEGELKETELEKVILRTDILRNKYKNSQSRAEKDTIGLQLLDMESLSYDLNNEVRKMYMQSTSAENAYWLNADSNERDEFIKGLNVKSKELNAEINKSDIIVDTQELIMPSVLLNEEEIKSSSVKENQSGVSYKIQLGAYSRGIPTSLKPVFSKISILRKVENYTDENGVVVYTTGNLTNYNDAVVMQKQIRQEGIKDPIIAAYLNGKRITLEQAKEIDSAK